MLLELLCSHPPFTTAVFYLQRKRLDFLSACPHRQHTEQEACETSQNSPVEFGTEQAYNKVESGLRMLQPLLVGCSIPQSLPSAALCAGPRAGGVFWRGLTAGEDEVVAGAKLGF